MLESRTTSLQLLSVCSKVARVFRSLSSARTTSVSLLSVATRHASSRHEVEGIAITTFGQHDYCARPAAGKRVAPLVMNSEIISGDGFVFMNASVSASTGVHCGADSSLWVVHSHPLGQHPADEQCPHGAHVFSSREAPSRPVLMADVEQRETHSLTQAV